MSYRLIHELSEAQVHELVRLYQGEWWSKGRTLSDVRNMLTHTSVIVGLVTEDNQLAAFARVLSDRQYWALIFDVIVHPAHRGAGLGERLVNAVMDHPAVGEARSVALCCRPELGEFYARWGFKVDSPDETLWMRRRKGTTVGE